jgi:hypothetical protein
LTVGAEVISGFMLSSSLSHDIKHAIISKLAKICFIII